MFSIARIKKLEEKEQGEGLSDAEWHERDALISARRDVLLQQICRPRCCEAAQKYPIITWQIRTDDGEEVEQGRWYINASGELFSRFSGRDPDWWNVPAPTCCPFCGTKLPNMVRKKDVDISSVCRIVDGGYYCDTCHDRLDSCLCDLRESIYEPEKP